MNFVDTQKQFVAWLRDPQNNPAPEMIESRRLAIYRRLVRNNVASFLASGFPVLKARTSADVWQAWVDNFLSSHEAQSPFFSDIGREFVQFLECHKHPDLGQFVRELARYERMDVDAMFALIPAELQVADLAQLETQCWFVSPAVFLDQFYYPVTSLQADQDEPIKRDHPQFVLVYRALNEVSTDHVQFLELTPLTAVLIELLQQTPGQNQEELEVQLTPLLPHMNAEQLRQGLQHILTDFAERSVLLVKR
ncbi:MAG TPA: putative DNA-binding domain-containing protein [Pseudidiomarina sp.]|nr:putative DNA-binding domain-containing protein [Pseudidiomarina sp.]